MSDYKSIYSEISNDYIEYVVPKSLLDEGRYNRSKERERKFNENWIKHKVNLNEIIDYFIPEEFDVVTQKTEGGVKYNFEGNRYIIKCDKVAGYLRIYDKQAKSYCLLDGTPSRSQEKTHFKIKRREEM
jgi:hypothetical protein